MVWQNCVKEGAELVSAFLVLPQTHQQAVGRAPFRPLKSKWLSTDKMAAMSS